MTDNLNIFIDTNVIVGAWEKNHHNEVFCLQYLYKLKSFHKRKIFVSSLTIAQLASMFQKKLGDTELRKRLKNLLSKFTALDFANADIYSALNLETTDIEDNIQYVIGKKAECTCFVTNNVKDYRKYLNIAVVKPEQIQSIY